MKIKHALLSLSLLGLSLSSCSSGVKVDKLFYEYVIPNNKDFSIQFTKFERNIYSADNNYETIDIEYNLISRHDKIVELPHSLGGYTYKIDDGKEKSLTMYAAPQSISNGQKAPHKAYIRLVRDWSNIEIKYTNSENFEYTMSFSNSMNKENFLDSFPTIDETGYRYLKQDDVTVLLKSVTRDSEPADRLHITNKYHFYFNVQFRNLKNKTTNITDVYYMSDTNSFEEIVTSIPLKFNENVSHTFDLILPRYWNSLTFVCKCNDEFYGFKLLSENVNIIIL